MISAGDFKNGITLEIDGNVCQIVEFQVHPERVLSLSARCDAVHGFRGESFAGVRLFPLGLDAFAFGRDAVRAGRPRRLDAMDQCDRQVPQHGQGCLLKREKEFQY